MQNSTHLKEAIEINISLAASIRAAMPQRDLAVVTSDRHDAHPCDTPNLLAFDDATCAINAAVQMHANRTSEVPYYAAASLTTV